MKTWTMEKNGRTLTIEMDETRVLSFWEDWLASFHKAAEIPDDRDEEREEYEANEYYRSRVNGGVCDPEFVSVDECIGQIEAIVDSIKEMVEMDADAIFNMAYYKKNGTFNRASKPILQQVNFGPYWEDSYGWDVECLRMEAIDDTHAHIVNTSYVQHY